MGKYIYYTTTDNVILDDKFINLGGYNAKIVSHTYTDGQGVIEFSGDVEAIPDGFCGGSYSVGPTNLKTIKFPNTIKKIGDYVIYYYSGSQTGAGFLTSVDFSECTELETIGNSFCEVGYNRSTKTNITEIDLSNCNKLTKIGRHFFDYVQSLKTIKWPVNGPELSIDDYLVSEGIGFEEFELPKNLVKWNNPQMNNWNNLKTIIIPDGECKLQSSGGWKVPSSVNKIVLSPNATGWEWFIEKFPNAEVIKGCDLYCQIARIQKAKDDLRNSIIAKGIDVPEDASLSYYPYFIEQINDSGYHFYLNIDDEIKYPSNHEVIEIVAPKQGDRIYTNIMSSSKWYVDNTKTVLNGGYIQTQTGGNTFNIDLPTVSEYTENKVVLRTAADKAPLIIVYKQG